MIKMSNVMFLQFCSQQSMLNEFSKFQDSAWKGHLNGENTRETEDLLITSDRKVKCRNSISVWWFIMTGIFAV